MRRYLRHYQHRELHGAFGNDTFGRTAERFARFFGTPKFILGQTCLVLVWIGINGLGLALRWDPYPFILLNLAFSTQAAYAAPLILLAQTRQADRDKANTEAAAKHRQEEFDHQAELLSGLSQLLTTNTAITEAIRGLTENTATLTTQLHDALIRPDPDQRCPHCGFPPSPHLPS